MDNELVKEEEDNVQPSTTPSGNTEISEEERAKVEAYLESMRIQRKKQEANAHLRKVISARKINKGRKAGRKTRM